MLLPAWTSAHARHLAMLGSVHNSPSATPVDVINHRLLRICPSEGGRYLAEPAPSANTLICSLSDDFDAATDRACSSQFSAVKKSSGGKFKNVYLQMKTDGRDEKKGGCVVDGA